MKLTGSSKILGKCCLLIAIFMLTGHLKAQATYTAADIALDSAVHHYNAYRNTLDEFTPANITDEKINLVESNCNIIVREFESIMALNANPQSEVAKYFHAMTKYEYGFVLGMAGKNDKAYRIMSEIEDYMQKQGSFSFPKKYLYDGKNYVIQWDNFAPTLHEYFTGMAEITINLGMNEKTMPYARSAMSLQYPNTGDNAVWYRYIAASKYMQSSKNIGYYAYDGFEVALNFLDWLYSLDADYQKLVNDYDYPRQVTAYNYILLVEKGYPATNTGENWLKAATAFMKFNESAYAGYCFNRAADLKYDNINFMDQAYAFAKNNNDNSLGLKICEIQESKISADNCSAWTEMAGKWETFGNQTRASSARAKADACNKAAADAQREYEANQRKQARKDNFDFSMYAGFYPLPLLTIQTNYWDYGGVLGLGLYNMQIEASYKIINRNLVFFEDLSWQEYDTPDQKVFWDGYRAHVAFKFGDRSRYGEGNYVGPLFEIVERNMTNIRSVVSDEATGAYIGELNFEPKETAYNVMLNFGVHIEENHLMADAFMGLGASYIQFSTGAQGYTTDEYLFSDPLLEYRKETRFGPMVRMGMTIGLSTRN